MVGPANASRSRRCTPGCSSRMCSCWPCTSMCGASSLASVVTGTSRPPTRARLRPVAGISRLTMSTPSSARSQRSSGPSIAPSPASPGLVGHVPGHVPGIGPTGPRRGRGPGPRRPRVAPAPDEVGGGASTEEELQCGDDHRLPGAGLPGDDREAGAEDQGRGIDDAERADVQLLDHRLPSDAPCVLRRLATRGRSPAVRTRACGDVPSAEPEGAPDPTEEVRVPDPGDPDGPGPALDDDRATRCHDDRSPSRRSRRAHRPGPRRR
jgi:hypothetical protein